MKHTEYGLKFVRKMIGNEDCREVMPIGHSTALFSLFFCLKYSGYLPSVDYLIIEPLANLIGNVVNEVEEFELENGITIEFTRDTVLLKEDSVILQTIPSVDFIEIMEEWRDFMNEPIEKDWTRRAPFKWFRLFE